VEQGLGRMDAFGRFRALDELHLDGQRVRLVMLQLVPVLGRLNQYLNIANDEWTSTNSIMQGFALQSETARAQFQRMWNNVQLLAVSLGTALLPVIKGVANGIGNMASDVREFVLGNGDRLRIWGESVGKSLETMGATFRVFRNNFRDIWQILGAQGRDIWGQIKQNATAAFLNILTIGTNTIDQMARYILAVLPAALKNAFAQALAGWAQMMPDALGRIIMGGQQNLANARNVAANLPDLPKAGQFLNPQNLMRGVVPMAGIQAPGMLGMIGGLFGNAAAVQRGERQRREAAGVLGDILVRLLGRGRGGGGVDRALGRQIGLANMEDQAAGLGGIGGGAGLGGVPAAPGAFGGLGGAMGPGGAGGAAGPPGVDPAMMHRMGLGMLAAGLPGAPAMIAGARHQELIAWRARMAARRGQGHQMGPGIVNPWTAIRNQLAARRQALWMALRHGRAPQDRLGVLRKVATEQRRQQEIRNQRRLAAAGAPEWANTAVGQIVAGLGRIERAIGIPQFGD
jgi:hypothetical protein